MADDEAARSAEPWSGVLSARIKAVHQQRAALLAAIDQTREARSLMFADDEHDPDGSTASLDQARDVALLTRADQTLAELAAAEERLAAGRYGVCERCGGLIAVERLQARPETRVCVACASVVPRRRSG